MYEKYTKKPKWICTYFSFTCYYNHINYIGSINRSVLNNAQQNNKTEESIQLDSVSKMGVDYFQ